VAATSNADSGGRGVPSLGRLKVGQRGFWVATTRQGTSQSPLTGSDSLMIKKLTDTRGRMSIAMLVA
jgi:hypothetical protein